MPDASDLDGSVSRTIDDGSTGGIYLEPLPGFRQMDLARTESVAQPGVRPMEQAKLGVRPMEPAKPGVRPMEPARAERSVRRAAFPDGLPERLWTDVFEKAKAASSTVPGVSAHKVSQMMWCLAEARREEDRLFLSKNWGHVSVGLMHDGRGPHVAVRYRAVTDRLEERCGLLALTTCPGGSKELADGIQKGVEVFFTRGAGALNDSRGVTDDSGVFQFARAVQTQCADGAAYAQLACRELNKVFPNLLAIVRDRGHSVVNTLKHATEADDVLRAWKEKFINGPMSVAKELTHCTAFRHSFELAHQAQQESQRRPDGKMPLMLSLQHLGIIRSASCWRLI